jgi:hypothetical protein
VSERKLIEDKGRYLETKARFQHIREKLQNMGMTAEELHQLEHGSHMEGHRYTLTSPIAGTVVAQHVVRGQGVAPGYELFEVVDTSRSGSSQICRSNRPESSRRAMSGRSCRRTVSRSRLHSPILHRSRTRPRARFEFGSRSQTSSTA